MNKIVEAVKEGREIETKDLFSVVNDFCLTYSGSVVKTKI